MKSQVMSGLTAVTALVALAGPSAGFNIDIDSAIVYQGQPGSFFGFSVAAHLDAGNGWVLVGAPESETEQARWGVHKPGAVLRCSAAAPFSCTTIPFDTSGNNNDTGTTIDDKSNQWFGATVSSSGPDGVVVACAPRYVYYSINKKRREPVGTCFTALDSFTRFSEYSPCRTGAWGYHRQGYCQAGLAAAATKERLFIGTPGSYYWQGQTYSQNLWNRMDLIATEEGPETEDNTYLGYSLTLGGFDGDSYPDLVVGMPRGANLTGKVIFLSGRSMGQLHNVTGAQVGAYFGHAVAVCDVNGDGLDDAVIGAPLHTNFRGANYETGRIYVVYQSKEHTFRKWHIRDGDQPKGRFGFALASLGDIDKDGYGDFAVGAPYVGAGRGEGAVYIFRGSRAGVREQPDQIIYGRSVSDRMVGFGFSLSGGLDLDLNSYPDLAVGAVHSDQAVLLRARPVVNLEAEVEFLGEGGSIDMEARDCETRQGEEVACTTLRLCARYSGVGVDQKLRISTRLELDTGKQLSSRMFFLSEEKQTLGRDILLTKEVQHCDTFEVYLIPNIRDKLSVVEARLTVSVPATRAELSPVLGLATAAVEFQSLGGRDTELVARDTLNIQKDCGPDNICIPDLKIFHTCNLAEYSVGSEELFEISLEIHNHGEDAYEATFYLALPESVNYVKTKVLEGYGEVSRDSIPVLCSPPTHTNEFVLKCDLGNPMEANSKAMLRVVLQPDLGHLEDVSSFQMRLEVNSSNPDTLDNLQDNVVDINLPVRVKTDLTIRGLSVAEVVRFNRSTYSDEEPISTEAEIGPEIMHIYQIENDGPSGIVEAEVYILWPAMRESSDPLLYLTEQPWVEGPGACQVLPDVNVRNIQLDQHRDSYSQFNHLENTTAAAADQSPDLSRPKRDLDPERDGPQAYLTRTRRDLDAQFLAELDCGPTKCTFISCVVGPLDKKGFTLIKLRSRLWVRTLDKVPRSDVEISSKLVTRVTKLPYGVNPEYLGYKVHHVTTQVLSLEVGPAGSIPLWILILAILAGLLFLGLLTFILHRLGFFRRSRPDDQDYQVTLQEKPYQGKESTNHMVGAQYHLLVNNSQGSSNGSAAWDRSRSSSQRLSINSTRNSTNSNTSTNIYYPGQRHPHMLPGDEAL